MALNSFNMLLLLPLSKSSRRLKEILLHFGERRESSNVKRILNRVPRFQPARHWSFVCALPKWEVNRAITSNHSVEFCRQAGGHGL